jgi:hypothetical protein
VPVAGKTISPSSSSVGRDAMPLTVGRIDAAQRSGSHPSPLSAVGAELPQSPARF